MKSPSNDHKKTSKAGQTQLSDEYITKRVNTALTQSADNLADDTLAELAKARNIALSHLKPAAQQNLWTTNLFNQIMQLMHRNFSASWINIGTPIALVFIVMFSFKTLKMEPIPALPSAMIGVAMPLEDLALLEDLDFVTWLAQNEQAALF